MKYYICLILFTLTLCACDPKEFRQAQKSAELGRYATAIQEFEFFAKQYPQHPKAPEALYLAGEIYRSILKDTPKATRVFQKVLSYPGTPWESQAKAALTFLPDYYPSSHWTERILGDSQSGGQYMLTTEKLSLVSTSGDRFKILRTIKAGQTLVSEYEAEYARVGNQIFEWDDQKKNKSVLLTYPIKVGTRWETVRQGRKMIATILDDNAKITVKAGTFVSCLKIREQPLGIQDSWKTEYFAPDIGLVLVTASTPRSETRISELISIQSKSQPQETAFLHRSSLDNLYEKVVTRIKHKFSRKSVPENKI